MSNGLDRPSGRWRRIRDWARPDGQLVTRVVKASVWVFALSLIVKVVTTARTVVLGNLLTPEDFGVIAVVMVITGLLERFTTTGFDAALVQKQGDVEDHLDTAWTVQIVRSLVLGIAVVLAAPLIGQFFQSPESVGPARLIGIGIAATGFRNPAVVYFRKELRFDLDFFYQLIPTVLGAATAVALAFAWRSYWAIAVGLVARKVFGVIASYIVLSYRPRLRFDRAKAFGLARFGKWIFGSNLLIYFLLNLDDFVVGRVVGVAALGLYHMAFSMSQIATTEVALVVTKVAFPTYARLQDQRPKLRRAYLTTLQLIALVTFPMTAGLFFVGPDATELLLGEKWLPMLGAFNVLLLWGLIRSLVATTGPLFRGIGRPHIQTSLQFAQFVTLAALILPLTNLGGIEGAAWATVLAAAIPGALLLVIAIRTVNGTVSEAVRILGVPLANGGLMLLALLGLRRILEPELGWAWLLGSIAAGAVLYLLLGLLTRRLLPYLPERLASKRAPAPE